MTHHDDLDRELVSWFSDDAARRVPAGLLGAVEAASRGRRQQPAWLVTLRGESMGAALAVPGRTRRLALVIAVAALAALLAIVIAGQQRDPLRAGLLAFIRNGDVYLAEPDGSDARVVLHQDGFAFSTVAWSPIGGRLAIDGGSGVVALDSSTGKTTFVGGSNPVWSPDGSELAVLDKGPGETGLRIVEAASLSTRAVYPFGAIGGLAWSPNGRWIAATGGEAARSIVRIDVNSGEVIQIEGPSGRLDDAREVSWSPDSLRVAFVRYGNGGDPRPRGCADERVCRVDVVTADADGTGAVLVSRAPGQGDMPSWSPDGKWLAYRATVSGPGVSRLAGRGIQVMRADGTEEQSFVRARVAEFAWSRDSASLWYTVVDGRPGAIQTTLSGETLSLDISIDREFNFESTGLRFAWQPVAVGAPAPPLPNPVLATPAPTLEIVTPEPAAPADLAATWPTLMAQRSEDACAVVRIAAGTGVSTTAAELCDPPASESYGGSLSPTGEAYALIRDGRLSILRTNGLAGIDVAGLTGLSDPTWSPDGTWLAVTGARSYLLHLDGSSLHAIPGPASWSPDAHAIAVAMADGTLLIGRPDGSDLHSIGVFPAPLTWAPDGSRFGFIRSGDVWTAAIDGSDVRNVTSFPLGGASDAKWSPDGSWIAVTAGRGVWLMGSDGAQGRWLDPGPGQFTSGVAWSPDSSRVAVQAYDERTAAGQVPLIYLVNVDGSPTIRIDTAIFTSWAPDGAFLVANEVEDGGGTAGGITVMNADGSGRHPLGTTAVDGPLVWLRQ